MQSTREYFEIVNQPGKFEGEKTYTPYFYDLMLDGDGEDVSSDSDNSIIRFEITAIDRGIFPNLEGFTHLELVTTPAGFVIGHTCIID